MRAVAMPVTMRDRLSGRWPSLHRWLPGTTPGTISAWWALALSSLLALYFGHHFAFAPGRVPSAGGTLPVDGLHQQFIFAEVARMISSWASLLTTDRVWFPVGAPFLLAKQNLIDAAFMTPITLWLGPARAIALFAFSVLLTNGLAGGWLARKVAGQGLPVLAGTVMLACSPYVLGELSCGRVTQAWLVPMVLCLGAAWEVSRPDSLSPSMTSPGSASPLPAPPGSASPLPASALEASLAAVSAGRPTSRFPFPAWLPRALLAGLALALCAYHYWFYGLFVAPAMAVLILARDRLRSGLPRLAVVGGVALLLTLPAILFVAGAWEAMPGRNYDASRFRQAAFLLAGLPGLTVDHLDAESRYLPQLLYLGVGLALFGWLPRLSRGLAAVFALLVLFSLGPTLNVGRDSLTLPYGWFITLPGMHRLWWPARALGAATVVALPLVALVYARLRARGVYWGFLALILLFLQAARLPGPVQGGLAPTGTTWSAQVPAGAVLMLPMTVAEQGARALFLQPEHGRPLVNGEGMWDPYLWPAGYKDFVARQPLLRGLLAAEEGEEVTPEEDWAARLAAEGVVAVLMPLEVLQNREAQLREKQLLVTLLGQPTCLPGDLHCYWALDVGP